MAYELDDRDLTILDFLLRGANLDTVAADAGLSGDAFDLRLNRLVHGFGVKDAAELALAYRALLDEARRSLPREAGHASDAAARQGQQGTHTLGERTQRVLEQLAADQTPDEVAQQLRIRVGTVYWHIDQAKAFFGVRHMAGLIVAFVAWRDARRR